MARYQDPKKGIYVRETRGPKAKYKFAGLKVGETRKYNTYTRNLRGVFDSFVRVRGLDWKAAIRQGDGCSYLTRIK